MDWENKWCAPGMGVPSVLLLHQAFVNDRAQAQVFTALWEILPCSSSDLGGTYPGPIVEDSVAEMKLLKHYICLVVSSFLWDSVYSGLIVTLVISFCFCVFLEHEYPDFWKSISLRTQYNKTAICNQLSHCNPAYLSLLSSCLLDTHLKIINPEEVTFSSIVFECAFLNILILVFLYSYFHIYTLHF